MSSIFDNLFKELPEASEEAKSIISDIQETMNQGFVPSFGDDFAGEMEIADQSLIDFLKTSETSNISLENYQKYLKQTSSATSALSTITAGAGKVMKIFAATAVNALASVVVAKIINEVIEAYDNWVHRIDNAKDAMEKSKDSYGEVSSELEELRRQSHEAQAKMKQMERTGLVGDDEYKKLQETNAELEREIKLLEARQKVLATEAWNTSEDWYDKTRQHSASGSDTSYNEKSVLNQTNASYNNSYLYDDGMIENNKDNINFLLGAYKGLSKLQDDNIAKIEAETNALDGKDEAASKAALDTIQGYESQNEVLDANIANIQTYLDEYRSGLDDLVTAYEQKKQLGSFISTEDTQKYNDAIVLIKIIDDLLIKTSTNAQQAGESFSNASDAINRFEISDSTKAEALTKINALKDGFDSLKDLYNSISEDKALDFSILDEDFEQIFSGAEAYQDFIDVITDSPDDIKGCQEAFDNLIYSWLHSEDIMSVLNDETVEMVGAFLEEQGVVDATSWLMAELAARKEMASGKTADLSEATKEEVEKFYEEYDAAENVKQALARLQLAKITLNGTVIDTSGDIDNLIALAEQAGATAEMLAATKNYNKVLEGYNTTVGDDILESDYLDAQKKAKAELRSVIDYKPGDGRGSSWNNSTTNNYNPPSSSSKSSGSSTSNKKEEIDWIARRNELLQKQHNIQEQIANDETASYNERKAALQELIDKDKKLADTAQESSEKYKQAWLEASVGLSEADKAKIANGSMDIDTYDSDVVGKEYIDNLKKSIEYYDLWKQYEQTAIDKKKEGTDHQRTSIQLLQEEINKQLDLNSALKDQVNTRMELLEAQGKYVNEGHYEELIRLSKEEVKYQQDSIDALYEQLELEDEYSAEWYGVKAQIEAAENAIEQCRVEQEELNDQIKRLPIERIQIFRDLYAEVVEDMDNYMSIQSSMGLNPTKEELQQYIDLYNEQIDSALEQQNKLKDLLEDYEYGSEKFNNTSKEIQDLDNEIASLIASQNEYNHQILQIPIDEMAEQVDKLGQVKEALNNSIAEDNANGFKTTVQQYKDLHSITLQQLNVLAKQKSALTEMLSVYDEESDYYKEIEEKIVSIDSEMSGLVQETYQWNQELLNLPIENLSRVNENLNNYSSILDGVMNQYDSALTGVNTLVDKQIDGLQTQLDLLDETNEARQIQLGIEQSLYNLRRAEEQKTTQVIRNGELVYESDADTLRSANQSYQDALLEKQKYDIGQQIESLEEIKDKWQEIIDKIQEAKDLQAAEDLFGSGWQDSVLSDTSDLRDLFQNLYESTSNQKEAVDKEIESNERISQMMNEFVTRYQEGSVTYEQALSGINELIGAMDDGYTALENLSGMMDLDNIGSLSDIASSTQQSIANSADLLSKYMSIVESNRESVEGFETNWPNMAESIDSTINSFNNAVNSIDSYIDVFNTNAEAINANNKIWDEMKDMITDQIEALKKAAEELEKLSKKSSSKQYSYEDDTDDSDYVDEKPIGVHHGEYGRLYYYDYENDTLVHPETGEDLGVSNYIDFMEKYEDDLKKGTYHKGIFKGSISGSDSQLDKDLQNLAILKDDEHVKVLQNGEYVYTPDQILNTIKNAQKMALPEMEPLLSHLSMSQLGNVPMNAKDVLNLVDRGRTNVTPNVGTKSTVNDISITFGGITMNEIQDVEAFTNELFSSVEPILTQKLRKIF